MQEHHEIWLAAHPHRSRTWLQRVLMDGFHIHHVDGDHSNNDPKNLILVEGTDHIALHSGATATSLSEGIVAWRTRKRRVTTPLLTEVIAARIDEVVHETSDTVAATRAVCSEFDLTWGASKRLVRKHLKRAA